MNKKQALENKVKRINELHSYLNEKVPLLIESLNNGFSISVNETLFKKDKERLYSIIDNKNIDVRAWLHVDKYSISMEADVNYPNAEDKNGYSSYEYYKKYAYLYDIINNKPNEFIPFEMITVEQIEQAEIELDKAEKEYRELGYKISKLKSFLNK